MLQFFTYQKMTKQRKAIKMILLGAKKNIKNNHLASRRDFDHHSIKSELQLLYKVKLSLICFLTRLHNGQK